MCRRHGYLPFLRGSFFPFLCRGQPPPRVGFPFLHRANHLTSYTPQPLHPVSSLHPYQPKNLHRNPFLCLGIVTAKPPSVTPPYHFPNLTLRAIPSLTTTPLFNSPVHNSYCLHQAPLPRSQTLDWHAVVAARDQLCCFLGSSFLIGDLLLLPNSISMPRLPATRPPPEPPPPSKVKAWFGSLRKTPCSSGQLWLMRYPSYWLPFDHHQSRHGFTMFFLVLLSLCNFLVFLWDLCFMFCASAISDLKTVIWCLLKVLIELLAA